MFRNRYEVDNLIMKHVNQPVKNAAQVENGKKDRVVEKADLIMKKDMGKRR